MSLTDKERIRIKEFCRYYNAMVRPGLQRFRVPKLTEIDFNTFNSNVFDMPVIEDLPTVEIVITESGFKALLDLEDRLVKYQQTYERYRDYVDNIAQREQREADTRDKNAAVKKAYEQYQLLLKLAQDNGYK